MLSKGLNCPVIFLSAFSKYSQRGCVSGFIFTFGVVQVAIGRLAKFGRKKEEVIALVAEDLATTF